MATIDTNAGAIVNKDGLAVTWKWSGGRWVMMSYDITDMVEFFKWADDNGYIDLLIEDSDILEHWEI